MTNSGMMDGQGMVKFLLRRHTALIFILLIFSLLSVDITAYAAEAGKNAVSESQPLDQHMLKALPTGIDAGLYHTLYIKKDGTLWSVGYNNNGQLGDGSSDTRSTPAKVASDVIQAAAGNAHSLYIKKSLIFSFHNTLTFFHKAIRRKSWIKGIHLIYIFTGY